MRQRRLLTSVAIEFLLMFSVRPAGPISVTCSSLAHRDALNVVKDVLVEGSPAHWLRHGHFLQLGSVYVSLTAAKDISLIRDTNASSGDMRF